VSFIYSDPVEDTLDLLGVWLHDPTDPAGTARNYPYGSAQRSSTLDIRGEGNFYAGRVDPVMDFGEHQEEIVDVTIDVPHGLTYRTDLDDLAAFAALKGTLVYRDNRGRAHFATMSDFHVSDQEWGSTVSFKMTRISYIISQVSV